MKVVVAGTFGPLHDGHRALIERALAEGDEGVVVGVTTDEFANATRDRSVPSHSERVQAVREAIETLDEWDREVEIRPVEDDYGFADDDPALDALVVSPETDEEVAEINRRREKRGMDPLETLVVPYEYAEDGERISSTRIVAGEIDEHGNLLS